uniref:Uncharacterized protein n=1 Tax=Romanomermis culicivorax TaxID=13658 RepID=A0A915HVP7_ROMCU
MAAIPIPPVTPLWEHPSTKIRHLSTWKQQLDVMYDLTNTQHAVDKKLKDAEKNLIMYAHLGTEAIRQFEHPSAMGQIWTMPHNEFYNAIDTQKRIFSSHITMLDVYFNIMQAAESAESSSPAIHGGSKDVRNKSHCDSDRYLDHGRNQSPN